MIMLPDVNVTKSFIKSTPHFVASVVEVQCICLHQITPVLALLSPTTTCCNVTAGQTWNHLIAYSDTYSSLLSFIIAVKCLGSSQFRIVTASIVYFSYFDWLQEKAGATHSSGVPDLIVSSCVLFVFFLFLVRFVLTMDRDVCHCDSISLVFSMDSSFVHIENYNQPCTWIMIS